MKITLTPSPMNTRFDKWAARHPRMALKQWNSASVARRASLVADAPAPAWHVTDLARAKNGAMVAVWG